MSSDFTEQQSSADLQRSKDLSLQRTRPPADVPGYQLDRFIGSGAYGEVWAGLDKNTGRKVAIKFYLHRHGVDWSLLSREVEKLRFLSADRYVVQLLEVGWHAEPPYYVMEYVEQGSLDDLLRRHGTFSVPEAVELFHEIAVGLAHAHGKGIVHCDLKPANVLLDQDHRPRLADFGQSRLSHEQKPALGTLFFMAPEQADLHASPDVRWDVYALGAILYTLLVGAPPHRNDSTVGRIDSATDLEDRLSRYRHSIRSAPPPAEHRKSLGMDRALAEIIDRSLAANPLDRFSNVQEILDALAARERNRKRLPLMVLGFLGPLLALFVTAFFSYRGYTRAVENAERGYGQYALENIQFNAQLAAEKMTAQLRLYFDIARDEVGHPDFAKLFSTVTSGSTALAQMTNPETPESELPTARTAFISETERLRLERHLQTRLEAYQEIAKRDPRAPKFASAFVTDRVGTQLAAAFDDSSISQSVGYNVSLRPYFSGGSDEGTQLTRPPLNPKHIERTHLSAVFLSRSQKVWKVAFSTPIFSDTAGQRQFAGVLVLTVNLADFDVSTAGMGKGHEQFLVLADGRQGEDRGKVLHHPLFDELAAKKRAVPEQLLGSEYRVSKELLSGEGTLNYEDPLGKYAATEPLAKPYDRRWLAASAPVLPPIGAGETSESGLVLIVQSDYDSVVRPAQQLGQQFVKNSFWMFIVMITASLSLWYIVVRTFREARAGLKRPASPMSASTPVADLTTIAIKR